MVVPFIKKRPYQPLSPCQAEDALPHQHKGESRSPFRWNLLLWIFCFYFSPLALYAPLTVLDVADISGVAWGELGADKPSETKVPVGRGGKELEGGEDSPGLVGVVAEVISADTIRLRGKRGEIPFYEVIFFQDLDGWEPSQTCPDQQGKPFPCGQLARQFLMAWILDKKIHCTVRGRDRIGRLTARCKAGGDDIGAQLVGRGHAIPAGSRTRYKKMRAQARQAGLEGWSGLPEYSPLRPRQWRRLHPRPPVLPEKDPLLTLPGSSDSKQASQ